MIFQFDSTEKNLNLHLIKHNFVVINTDLHTVCDHL